MSKPRRRLPCNGARCWSLSIIIVGCTLRRDLDTKEVGTLGIRFSPQHVGQTCPLRKESSMISYLEHARKDATIQIYTVIHNWLFIYIYIYSIYARVCIYTYIHNKQSTDTDAIQGPVLSHLLLSTGSCSSWASGFSMAFCNQGIHAFLPGQLCGPSARCIQRWLIHVSPTSSHDTILSWYSQLKSIGWNSKSIYFHLLPFTSVLHSMVIPSTTFRWIIRLGRQAPHQLGRHMQGRVLSGACCM